MQKTLLLVMMGACSLSWLSCATHVPATDVERFWKLQRIGMFEPPEGPKTCPLHRVTLELGEAVVEGGMCAAAGNYMKAKLRDFPYGYLRVNNCRCEDRGGYAVPRFFCPVCRAAERKWLKSHGREALDAGN